jgi:hypothetical protein
MGRINRSSEAALRAAAEMLETSKDQKFRAQLSKTILDYDLRKQEIAASNKAARRKRVDEAELSELRSQVDDLTNQLASIKGSRAKEISDLQVRLKKAERSLDQVQSDLGTSKQEAATARRDIDIILKLTNGIMGQLAATISPANRNEFASQLFQQFNLKEPELLAQLFKSMKLDLKRWQAWDSDYGENTEAMVQEFESLAKQDPQKLSLLRSKLSAQGFEIDAINAMRDYRDTKITFAQLKERTRPHIAFAHDGEWRIQTKIDMKLMPRVTQEALRSASQKMQSDPAAKLQWLEIHNQLPMDSEVGTLILKEILATRR